MEVAYAEFYFAYRSYYFDPLVGGIQIYLVFHIPSLEKIKDFFCTLGYTGWLYGTVPVIVTAWHCSYYVWGQNVFVDQPVPGYYLGYSFKPAGCIYKQIDANTIVTYCDIMTIPVEGRNIFLPGVYRPSLDAFGGWVIGVYGRYDVPWFGELHKAGISTDVTSGPLLWYCVDMNYPFIEGTPYKVTVRCQVVTGMSSAPGDSGSPVYVLTSSKAGGTIRLLYAYGILSGTNLLGMTVLSPLDAYHLYVKYT
ncbi:MAG: hypothetical protein QXJ71_01210 [Pyrobaculum sp.]